MNGKFWKRLITMVAIIVKCAVVSLVVLFASALVAFVIDNFVCIMPI